MKLILPPMGCQYLRLEVSGVATICGPLFKKYKCRQRSDSYRRQLRSELRNFLWHCDRQRPIQRDPRSPGRRRCHCPSCLQLRSSSSRCRSSPDHDCDAPQCQRRPFLQHFAWRNWGPRTLRLVHQRRSPSRFELQPQRSNLRHSHHSR